MKISIKAVLAAFLLLALFCSFCSAAQNAAQDAAPLLSDFYRSSPYPLAPSPVGTPEQSGYLPGSDTKYTSRSDSFGDTTPRFSSPDNKHRYCIPTKGGAIPFSLDEPEEESVGAEVLFSDCPASVSCEPVCFSAGQQMNTEKVSTNRFLYFAGVVALCSLGFVVYVIKKRATQLAKKKKKVMVVAAG